MAWGLKTLDTFDVVTDVTDGPSVRNQLFFRPTRSDICRVYGLVLPTRPSKIPDHGNFFISSVFHPVTVGVSPHSIADRYSFQIFMALRVCLSTFLFVRLLKNK